MNMTAEMLAAIVALIALLGTTMGVWLNLNLKIKEIEMKIAEIEHKFIDVEKNNEAIIRTIEKNNDKIYEYLEKIDLKLEKKFEMLTILKSEHDQIKNNCAKK